MKKHYLLLLISVVCFTGNGFAQSGRACGTDEMHRKYKEQNPNIAIYEKQLEASIQNYIKIYCIQACILCAIIRNKNLIC